MVGALASGVLRRLRYWSRGSFRPAELMETREASYPPGEGAMG